MHLVAVGVRKASAGVARSLLRRALSHVGIRATAAGAVSLVAAGRNLRGALGHVGVGLALALLLNSEALVGALLLVGGIRVGQAGRGVAGALLAGAVAHVGVGADTALGVDLVAALGNLRGALSHVGVGLGLALLLDSEALVVAGLEGHGKTLGEESRNGDDGGLGEVH
ncbi:hypothetical protein B0J12DRAFT_754372, partial [Macrophomina phaseolina]